MNQESTVCSQEANEFKLIVVIATRGIDECSDGFSSRLPRTNSLHPQKWSLRWNPVLHATWLRIGMTLPPRNDSSRKLAQSCIILKRGSR
jgi:hypothetical protein